MNKNDFIDSALKEHARLEGNDDQGFLDELESQLDVQDVTEVKRKSSKKKGDAKKYYWPAVAATVAVSVFAIHSMNQDGKPDDSADTASLVDMKSAPEKRDERMASLDSSEGKKGKVVFAADESPRAVVGVEERQGNGESGVGKDDRMVSLERSRRMKDPSIRPGLSKKGVDYSFEEFDADSAEAPRPSVVSKPQAGKSRGSTVRYAERFEDGFGEREFGIDRQNTGEKYGALVETGFLSPLSAALSTFSIDVDTASYSNIRRHIMNGQSINPNAVRIEEMINYFDYHYAQPEGEHPFAVHTEVASCPWNPKHRLVRIGLQGETIDESERKAANLVFLLDVSGSMNSPDKLPLLVQSFQILLKQLNENDRVSLVVYAGRQAVLLNPTAIDEDGRTQVSQALKRLSAGGSTAGAAGIKTAYELARKGFVNGGVNRVILATDGDFNVGTTNHEALLKLVKQQADGDISLTVLGFGQGNLNDAMMEKLTNSGDGNYFYIDSLREGQKVFQQGLTGTIQTIAKDVKIQVEFNPGKVGQYRLIGYANRRLKDEDFKNDKVDAGDIGAGHRVTALYEIIPTGVVVAEGLKYQKVKEMPAREIVDSPEMLTVKLRYKQPDGKVSTELARPLTDEGNVWEMASEDFRFSSSVALWGMLLRNSGFAGNGTPELVSELALGGQGDDVKGERAEMVDLVRRWSSRR